MLRHERRCARSTPGAVRLAAVNDPSSMRTAAYAQVRVREPLGERVLGETTTIGGEGADVVVPGAEAGAAVTIERRKGIWVLEPSGKAVRLDGRPLTVACDLRRSDTLSIGDAQIVVAEVSRTLLRVDVHHLVGNTTIAPAATLATLVLSEGGDEDVEIHPLATLRVPILTRAGAGTPRGPDPAVSLQRRVVGISIAAVVLLIAVVAALLQAVPVDVRPFDARLSAPGTLLAIPNAGHMLLLPGKHVIRAERDGYVTGQADIEVRSDNQSAVRLRLAKLPGKLSVDTGGVAATVSVDGLEVGHAPGELSISAGQRTLIIRAPRYVDYITNVTIAGAGEHQDLHASLQTSWGNLKVLSIPEGAHVSVDGVDSGVAPVTVAAPSGVRRVELTSSGWKTWESSVVLKAGETLSVGPVTLGQPDAHLIVRSEPAGADATVGGTHLGRTPAEIDLPSGIAHEVVLSAPGYKNWTRAVFADPGRKLSVLARLEPILVRVSVQGEPADAELFVDAVARGKAPQVFELSATDHHIEVRKAGFQPFKITVSPAANLDRTVQYRLVPARPN
jgi:PEGA domain